MAKKDKGTNKAFLTFYDPEVDILKVCKSHQKVKCSVKFQNFIIDIGSNKNVIGLEILDASQFFSISRKAFAHITDSKFITRVYNEATLIKVVIAFEKLQEEKQSVLLPIALTN